MSAQSPTFGELRYQLSQSFPGASLPQITAFLNARYRTVARKMRWTDLSIQAVLQTVAPYETGTVALTLGSTAVTGTSTVFALAMNGRAFRTTGRNEYYQFTYSSATAGTLDRAYEGPTATGLGYKIFQSIYVLPADCRLVRSMRVLDSPRDMDEISQEDLDQRAPQRSTYGAPSTFSPHMVDTSTPPRRQVELYPIPDRVMAIPFWYLQEPTLFAIGDTAVYLPSFLDPSVLLYGVEADIQRIILKDYNGAAAAEALFGRAVSEMMGQEADRTPNTEIRMAARFVRHRIRRWMR